MLRSSPKELLRTVMARYVNKELIPKAQEIDEHGEFPWEIFREIGRMGLFGMRYPAKDGGAGGDSTLFCIACEELARGSMSVAAIVAMQSLMGTNFLYRYGGPELREMFFLPAMKGEKVAAFALTEPDAASDLGAVRTAAARKDGAFEITGLKTWITNGPVADFFTVLCQTDKTKGIKGLNFFFVPRETPGVSTSRRFDLLGTRSTPISEVAFSNCLIPLHYRLGGEGHGVKNLMGILAEIRTMTAALGLGLARAALDDSLQYAKERTQFGKPIGNYQLIQAKVADMATEIEASRLMIYNTTRMIDEGRPCMKEASMAKYFATETACRAADQATRIFASYSYAMDYRPQRYYRDCRFLLYGGGTSEILQTIIAREVGLQ
ncbi:MAG: acyl-CoA dehydrogenase family protein [Deltaproteobacteria bacterium]|nr:acyl-CoA dehydrogenase family protein [Deltaproteobacteria bacterium]